MKSIADQSKTCRGIVMTVIYSYVKYLLHYVSTCYGDSYYLVGLLKCLLEYFFKCLKHSLPSSDSKSALVFAPRKWTCRCQSKDLHF